MTRFNDDDFELSNKSRAIFNEIVSFLGLVAGAVVGLPIGVGIGIASGLLGLGTLLTAGAGLLIGSILGFILAKIATVGMTPRPRVQDSELSSVGPLGITLHEESYSSKMSPIQGSASKTQEPVSEFAGPQTLNLRRKTSVPPNVETNPAIRDGRTPEWH